jgi:hypothetical protein
MTKEAEAKFFGEILEAADKLSLEEQEALSDVLSRSAGNDLRIIFEFVQ